MMLRSLWKNPFSAGAAMLLSIGLITEVVPNGSASAVYAQVENQIDQTITERLSAASETLDDGSYYNLPTFSGTAGQSIVIEMRSRDFDTYLILFDEQGNRIAENDDDGTTTDAEISLTLPATGSYVVVANSYAAGETGTYTLRIRSATPGSGADTVSRSLSTSAAQNDPFPVAEGVINADELVTINGIPWAANGWSFSKVLDIQRDSIDSTIVGRVVLDRHGIDTQPIFGISAPFASPYPGRFVIISSWGSNDNGCFAELIFQVATPQQEVDGSVLIPTQIEMVLNGERVTLNAVENAPRAGRSLAFEYTYSKWVTRNGESVSVSRSGTWVMARHLFPVDADQASALRSAPVEDVPIRITLANRSPVTMPIGDQTVERWASAYNYNASCTPR